MKSSYLSILITSATEVNRHPWLRGTCSVYPSVKEHLSRRFLFLIYFLILPIFVPVDKVGHTHTHTHTLLHGCFQLLLLLTVRVSGTSWDCHCCWGASLFDTPGSPNNACWRVLMLFSYIPDYFMPRLASCSLSPPHWRMKEILLTQSAQPYEQPRSEKLWCCLFFSVTNISSHFYLLCLCMSPMLHQLISKVIGAFYTSCNCKLSNFFLLPVFFLLFLTFTFCLMIQIIVTH